MDRRGLGTAIDHRDAAEDVLGVRLGVLDEHVEVPVGGEDVGHGIEQLELRLPLASRSVGLDERLVREGDLRILVDHFHVGVRRRAVEVEVVLLHVLAVVALLIAEAERALLQERVLLVPQRDGEADGLPVVAEPGEAILAPAIRPAPRVVVREVVPGVSARAVVLSHGAPRAIADVRAPAPPFALARRLLLETRVLSGAAPATGDRGARGRSGRSCGGARRSSGAWPPADRPSAEPAGHPQGAPCGHRVHSRAMRDLESSRARAFHHPRVRRRRGDGDAIGSRVKRAATPLSWCSPGVADAKTAREIRSPGP